MKLTTKPVDQVPPKRSKAADRWAPLEQLLDRLPAGECVLIEPDAGEKPRGLTRGLGAIAKRRQLEVRRDPDGLRVWLVPLAPAPSVVSQPPPAREPSQEPHVPFANGRAATGVAAR